MKLRGGVATATEIEPGAHVGSANLCHLSSSRLYVLSRGSLLPADSTLYHGECVVSVRASLLEGLAPGGVLPFHGRFSPIVRRVRRLVFFLFVFFFFFAFVSVSSGDSLESSALGYVCRMCLALILPPVIFPSSKPGAWERSEQKVTLVLRDSNTCPSSLI